MAITFRQLEIFVAVAETSQVTRASKSLDLTQSAVSMALAELESQLGGPLFDRYGRSLLLNDRGRYLLPQAKDMLRQVSAVESMLTGQGDEVAGVLHIVASTTIGNYVLPYLLGAFMHKYPEAHVNMMVVNTRLTERWVAQGHADLGFIEGDISEDGLVSTPWFMDEMGIIVGPRHPLAGETVFHIPGDLKKTSWILREDGSGTAEYFTKRLGRHAQSLKVITKTGYTEAIKKQVEAGIGAACLSRLTVAREVEDGWLKFLEIAGVNKGRQFWTIQHKDKVVTRLMSEFLSFCEHLVQKQHLVETLSSPRKLQAFLESQN